MKCGTPPLVVSIPQVSVCVAVGPADPESTTVMVMKLIEEGPNGVLVGGALPLAG